MLSFPLILVLQRCYDSSFLFVPYTGSHTSYVTSWMRSVFSPIFGSHYYRLYSIYWHVIIENAHWIGYESRVDIVIIRYLATLPNCVFIHLGIFMGINNICSQLFTFGSIFFQISLVSDSLSRSSNTMPIYSRESGGPSGCSAAYLSVSDSSRVMTGSYTNCVVTDS